jgi:hypothetical protein
MHSGEISNNSASGVHAGSGPATAGGGGYGGGIITSGAFIMNDGTIGNNFANVSSGIHSGNVAFMGSGGSIELNGGTVSHNRGGVAIVARDFTMNGGIISYNEGDGVSVASIFTMHSGTISHNQGVGVRNDATFNMNGGTISFNGSGVSNSRTFTMNNGTIIDNNGSGVSSSGNNGNFTLNNGTIGRNAGAGVFTSARFNMNGGLIYSNLNRGVNHTGGAFNFDGGWIFDNTRDGVSDDISIAQAGTFNNNVWDMNIGAIGSHPHGFVCTLPALDISMPQESEAPQEIISITEEWIARGTVEATPTTATVLINGQRVAFQAFNIEGSNYFRLRDLSYALRGTSAQFNVGWDEANGFIIITLGEPYEPIGGEMQIVATGAVTATANEAKLYFPLGSSLIPEPHVFLHRAANIDGSNYLMLRDLSPQLGFDVDWDTATSTILITTR